MVNLTPLIDVVFLLLIFFMVTAQFQEDERDLSITVPEAENGDVLENPPETVIVGVRRDGGFSVGGKLLDRDELKRFLARAKRKNEKQRVVIRADRDAMVRHAVTVLDLCAGLEITSSIAAAPARDGG